jgi:SNF2 family DNA or RNA helicase
MYVADEARRIKNPTADRTKVVVKSAVFAPYRRLLNGTPVPNGPFDLYSQLKFLDENFWEPHGITGFTAFKNMFGVFQKGYVRGPGGVHARVPAAARLQEPGPAPAILGTICSRVTKEEVLNLPPKLYSRASFEITAAQRKVYEQLTEEFMAQLETGEYVSAPLAITRLAPLPAGHERLPPGGRRRRRAGAGHRHHQPPARPAGHHLRGHPSRMHHMGQIQSNRRPHSRATTKSKVVKHRPVRRTGGDAREEAKIAFQEGKAQFFVAKQSTAGEGLTLTQAKTVIYVENTFDLAARLQSEDRAHRIGQEHPVNYIDMLALGTVDQHIVKCLVDKMDVANEITGDRVKQWLALK